MTVDFIDDLWIDEKEQNEIADVVESRKDSNVISEEEFEKITGIKIE